jgi:peptide-methionine (S)-S-oxide reductase
MKKQLVFREHLQNKTMKKLFSKEAVTLVAALFFMVACAQAPATDKTIMTTTNSAEQALKPQHPTSSIDTATFGAGCFWCVEAVFQRLDGVLSVKSGYAGGKIKNPTYKEVCSGLTGHAEVCQITFDTTKVSFDELLEVFWKTHDPTTLNRQGADAGTQYRSAVFYHNEDQHKKAESYKKELDASGAFDGPITTEIVAFTNYSPAEDYHQNYFNQNGQEGYCKFVIQPKVEKFEKVFKDKLKKH